MSNQSERHVKLIGTGFAIVINPFTRSITNHTETETVMEISSQQKGAVFFAMARNDDGKLVACAFSEESKARAAEGVVKSIPKHLRQSCRPTTPDDGEFERLYEIYVGRGDAAPDSFDLSHTTPFKRKVYLLMHGIPRGNVTTYGSIAKKMGSDRYARAVGTAVGSNPLPLVIPCHRVVTASLEVLNYGMPGRKPDEGAGVKRGLLEREGVKFHEGRVSRESLWRSQ